MIQPGEYYKIREDGRWEIYMDASMCGAFGLCQQYFEYSYVKSITPKGEVFFARDLGSWWSKVMENIYTAEFNAKRLMPQEVLAMAMSVWNEMKLDELERSSPKQFKEFGGRYGAIAMISNYASTQLQVDYQTWKIVAAEASFGRNKEVCIGETSRIILYWMGQPDLYVVQNDRLMPVDHKSVGHIDANISLRYKPHIQIPGYIIAGQVLCKSLGYDLIVDRAIVNTVGRSDRTDKSGDCKTPRFKRIPMSYNPEELEEWKILRLRQAELLRDAFESGTWTRNEYACTNIFMKTCPYHDIDSKPPSVRPVVIAANYKLREKWIPGKTTEEKKDD